MFILVDGIMGSGKTYYAVNYIYENRGKYHRIFTNINGFKFFDNIEPLYFDYAPDGSKSLLDYFSDLKDIYDRPDTTDDDLHSYLIENNFIIRNGESFKPFLVVIDEAQNYFDKKNDLLIWMQTYHRHLYCDFILITQAYNLLYSSYHKQFEYFVHAIPLSRQLFTNKFKYQKHVSVPYRDTKPGTKVGDILLPHKKDVFSMYQSGDKVRVKSFIHKYIYYFLGFVFLMIVGFIFFVNYFFGSHSTTKHIEKKSHIIKTTNVKKVKNDYVDDGYRYLRIRCFNYRCFYSDLHIDFDFRDLNHLIDITSSKFIRADRFSYGYVYVYLIASPKFLSLFQGASKNETDFSLLPSFGK